MRTLLRNKRDFYYAIYLGKEAVVDEDGFKTGEYNILYSDVEHMSASISPRTGETFSQPFGTDVSFDQVIMTDDMNCPLDENSILCIDLEPVIIDGKLTNYDFIVTKKSKSLNSIAYAVTKVKVYED